MFKYFICNPLPISMSKKYTGNPTTTLTAQKCWRTKKEGTALEKRGGKGLILIKFYPICLESSNPQPFIQKDQGCMEILRTGIASKAMPHKTDKATVVINCQDWAHRESLKNPIKRSYYLKFKTNVRADFFTEIWNEHFDEYRTHQNTSLLCSADGLDAISEDPFVGEGIIDVAPAAKPIGEVDGDNFDVDQDHGHCSAYAGNYSDEDDLFEETQPTTEPLCFELKIK